MPGGLNTAIETTWRAFRADGLMAVATVMLALLLLAGLFGPLLPIGDPTAIGAGARLASPSLEFPLGTDELGRSNLPRVVGGIYVTFVVAAVAVLLTGMLGVMIGLTAAYLGGRFDMAVARLADILYAFPAIILGLMLASIIGPGSIAIISVIVAATLPLFIRVVRSVALSIASREFVTAAEVAGASALRVMLVHLLPNVAGAVIIQLTYALSIGMLIESALSFLGLGTQPPSPSLGSLLQLGAAYLTIAPWLVFPPGLILALAILSVNLVGDGLRDAIDPLRGKSLT
jgi:peptide/nickel transport system permease protein